MAMKRRMKGGPRSTVTSLNVAAKLWPTPTAHEGKGSGPSQYERNSLTLQEAASAFPSGRPDPTTPKDGESSSPSTRVLNPRFNEMLMGWPPHWTCVCEPTRSGK